MDQIRQIATADGTMSVAVFHPAGATTGVILYQDAFGPRPALSQMAARIASWGHVVLVPDLFYRFGPYSFDAKTAFGDEATRGRLMSMMQATTQAMTMQDGAALMDLLTELGATGPVGTTGYCMGGARSLNAAAAYPDRITAAASFHGGNLATDQPGSPHLNVGRIKARVYVGGAGVDRSFLPEQSALLAQALREAEVDHILENYVGMQHGWTVPDSLVFDAIGAERHWHRLQTLFTETLLA